MSKISIGLEGKAYILTSGTRASWGSTSGGVASGAAPGSLAEVDLTRNASLNLTSGEANLSSRKSVWELVRKSLKKCDIDLELPWDTSDTNLNLLIASYAGNTSVAMAFLDQDKANSGAQGVWADFEVMECSREENLDKEQIAKVKLKPTYSTVAPQWVKVA